MSKECEPLLVSKRTVFSKQKNDIRHLIHINDIKFLNAKLFLF